MQKVFEDFFSGYTEICEMEDGYFYPHRFSRKLRIFFEEIKFERCNCSAGIIIKADKCNKIKFDYRTYDSLGFSEFDVLYKNTQKMEHITFSNSEGTFEVNGNGGSVEIYLGYQNMFAFKNILIDAIPAKKPKNTILCYGDSITHGYHCQYSSEIFSAVLGRNFDAEVYNFGIGGLHTKKEVIKDIKAYEKPLFITHEYGTNDWNYEKDTKEDIKFIFKNLNQIYSDVPVFVILPLPRKTQNEVKNYGTLMDFREWIRDEAMRFKNLIILDYFNDFDVDIHFATDGIHPNNDGEHMLSSYILRDIKSVLAKGMY